MLSTRIRARRSACECFPRERLDPPKFDQNPLLSDKEYIELARLRAWPEGIVADDYVAQLLDYEAPERDEPTGPTASILHGLLRG